jgi:hypothetical protein
MVIEAGDSVFIDSNMLVYASEERAPFHTEALSHSAPL